MKTLIQIAVTLLVLSLTAGCCITFDGPQGWDLDQNAQDTQWEFNHMGTSEPR